LPKITYYNGSTDAYSGQVNMEAAIYVDGQIVGAVEYVLYDGELTVSDIQIRPEYRRMGYGSRLMKYIKEQNPEYRYVPSFKTEDGAAFKHKDLPLDEKMKAKFVSESLDFERGIEPKKAMGIGLESYSKKLFNAFFSDLSKEPFFPDLISASIKDDEGYYIHIPLDGYSETGMNNLEKQVRKLIRMKYKGKLAVIDDNFLEKLYVEDWPDESPFFNEEDLLIKIL
jgi:GNAT superfamily N-acetyltransferase